MVGLQTLDLAIGVRVPASQPKRIKHLRAAHFESPVLCVYRNLRSALKANGRNATEIQIINVRFTALTATG